MDGPTMQMADNGAVVVEGVLDRHSAAAFAAQLERATAAGDVLMLDLRALEVEDAVAVVVAVDALRRLLATGRRVVVTGAPQVLGHNLYRVGLLDSGQLSLVDMREDEAYG